MQRQGGPRRHRHRLRRLRHQVQRGQRRVVLALGGHYFCRGCIASINCWSKCCSTSFSPYSCAASDCAGNCDAAYCPAGTHCVSGGGTSSDYCACSEPQVRIAVGAPRRVRGRQGGAREGLGADAGDGLLALVVQLEDAAVRVVREPRDHAAVERAEGEAVRGDVDGGRERVRLGVRLVHPQLRGGDPRGERRDEGGDGGDGGGQANGHGGGLQARDMVARGHHGDDARAFRILNVFTVGSNPFSGNPLCVVEDGRGLDDGAMQAIARQFNLSETTFVLPASAAGATARVRIFTPTFEMPFAGHPTLGPPR